MAGHPDKRTTKRSGDLKSASRSRAVVLGTAAATALTFGMAPLVTPVRASADVIDLLIDPVADSVTSGDPLGGLDLDAVAPAAAWQPDFGFVTDLVNNIGHLWTDNPLSQLFSAVNGLLSGHHVVDTGAVETAATSPSSIGGFLFGDDATASVAAPTGTAAVEPASTALTAAGPESTPAAAAVLSAAGAPAAADAEATYAVVSQWDNGFTGGYTITNPGDAPLTNWKLEFDLPQGESITSVWNGVMTHTGNHYVITPESWNGTIAPGGVASVGFQATNTGDYGAPINLVVNGHAVDGGSHGGGTGSGTGNDGGAGDTGAGGGDTDTGTDTGSGGTGTSGGDTGSGGSDTGNAGGSSDAGAAQATYAVVSQWDNGFTGGYTITNPGDAPLTNWKLEFDLPQGESITSVWNGVMTHTGNHYVITPESWNGAIAPGSSAEVGFQATNTGDYSPPINVQINGHAVDGGSHDSGGDTGTGTDGGSGDNGSGDDGSGSSGDNGSGDNGSGDDGSGDNGSGGSGDGSGGSGDNGSGGAGDNGSGGSGTGDTGTGAAQATYAVISQWDNGFTGGYTVTNPGDTPLTNWKIEFDLPANESITSVWSGVMTHDGNHYVITPESWNGTIAPGAATSVGFQATNSGHYAPPMNLVINGQPVDSGTDDGGGSDPGTGNDGGTGTGTGDTGSGGTGNDGGAGATPWVFAPYVDLTLWPSTLFDPAAAAAAGVKDATLAFIVSDSQGDPAWGGYDAYAINGGSQISYIDDQIDAMRSHGIDPIISFGGANGTYLSNVPGITADQLEQDYLDVVNTYGVHKLDFDIEGGAQQNIAALTTQAQALAHLQEQQEAAGTPVEVSYTLPVLPTGLTADGLRIIEIAKDNGVDISRVNIMAMDYYSPTATDMGDAAIAAATATHDQLMTIYPELTSDEVWSMIGITPMIGVNDDPAEIFGLSDAQQLADFAAQNNVGLLSMWSAARDTTGQLGVASPTGSGIVQTPLAFSKIFGQYDDAVSP